MTEPVLRRTLGVWDGAALVVANVIGVGIFTTPGIVAGYVGAPGPFVAVWLAGGAYALVGALAYAELATLLPASGGEYLYLSRAFGPLAGFLTGWTSFVAGFSGAIAASAIGFAAYLERYLPAAASPEPWVVVPLGAVSLSVSPQTLVALAVVVAIAAVHAGGIRPGRRVQNSLALLSVLTIVGFVTLGFALGTPAPDGGVGKVDVAPSAWLLALVPVLFTYSGWNAAVYVAEEVRDPERTLWRALVLGTAAVTAAYALLNLLFLYALPLGALVGTINVGDVVAEALLGSAGAALLTAVVLLALVSSVSAMTMAGPRVYFAMARDGLFPRPMARLDARHRTPRVAIWAQAGWSGLLVLTGTFEALLLYTGVALVLFSALAVAALFRLRPAPEGLGAWVRTRGLPTLYIVVSLGIVANALWRSPGPSLAGLLIIAAGLPVYAWLRRR